MSASRKLDKLAIACWLPTKNNFDYLADQSRPITSTRLTNKSAEPITIAPGETVFVPNLFLNKWQMERPTVEDKTITIVIDVEKLGTHPWLANAVK